MTKVQISISLTPEILKEIDNIKRKEERSRNWIITALLIEALIRRRKREAP